MGGSGKSQIKSKKTKLMQKKQEKSKPINKVIQVVSSSEDEHHNQFIEKRRKGPPKVAEQPKKYNSFNIQKLKKVQYQPNKALLNQKPLVIQQTAQDNPMQHPQARITFSYKIQGQQSTKYVSDMHLQQRAKKITQEELAKVLAEEKEKQKLKDQENKQANQLDEQSKKGEQVEQRKRASRYFQNVEAEDNENRLVKCFRCGLKGHIAKNCLQEKLQAKCTFCLGDHYHHDCNSRACFRCNELGHIAQDCKTIGAECKKCGKKGHNQKGCGAIVYLDFSRIKSDHQYRQKYNVQDLKKLRCMAGCDEPDGHFNCHKYQQFHRSLPFDTFMRYNDHPEHHYNSMGSNNHTFIDYQRQVEQYRPSYSSKNKGKNNHYQKHNSKQNHQYHQYRNSNYNERSYSNHKHNSYSNHHERYDHRSQRW